jgi:hypothetical protein
VPLRLYRSKCGEYGGTGTSYCEYGGTGPSYCEYGGTGPSYCEYGGTGPSYCEYGGTGPSYCEYGGTGPSYFKSFGILIGNELFSKIIVQEMKKYMCRIQNFKLEQATKAQRVTRGIALLFL